ncbi:MAG: sugar phosphate nucleotidyltransferase [bacterium]|nr:sugar phosphate nucleotidyltransferase [bacterium]
MQAVILAAGEGKRLRPLTEDRPKPMVPIGDMPILEYTIGILPKVIDEVILVVGYKKEKIHEHFGNEWKGRKITYIDQPEPKGTGEALERVRHLLRGEHFMLIYGDDLYHPEDLERCTAHSGMSILVKEAEFPERMGVCMVEDEMLKGIIEKSPNPPTNLATIGVYVLHQAIFDVPKVFDAKGEHVLSPQIGDLSKTHPIKIIRAQFWHPIGYPEDVEKAKLLLPDLLDGKKAS